MNAVQSIYRTYRRYQTLRTHKISSLPIAILMPHSACNCRCVMCDIWKGNRQLKQLNENDVLKLLSSLKKLGTQQVLMSGGEALLHPNFFSFCEHLKKEHIKITLLSTGLALKSNANGIAKWLDEVILSLDGDEALHDSIRNIPGAYKKMKEGIEAVRQIRPDFKISGRTVIHQLNFRFWPEIIESAKELGLDSISFLPADVSSTAFNRNTPWTSDKQQEILLTVDEVSKLKDILDKILADYANEIKHGFIAEQPTKLQKICTYYSAHLGLNEFPYKKCNAPWVSAVVEADGSVRPCFFHPVQGNIHDLPLDEILNSNKAIDFRKELDMDINETCAKCVCYLHLSPGKKLA